MLLQLFLDGLVEGLSMQFTQRQATRIHVLGQLAGQALVERHMLHVNHHRSDVFITHLVGNAMGFNLRGEIAHAYVARAVCQYDQ